MASDSHFALESTGDKIGRELNLVGQGLSGFGEAARDAFSNHKSETLEKAGTAVALGLGLAAVRRLPGIGVPVAAAISAGLFSATIKNIAETGFETVKAFTDSWSSSSHFQENQQIVRRDIGQFAFDSAVMAGAAGLSAGAMRAFGPAIFRYSLGSIGDMQLPSAAGDTPQALSGAAEARLLPLAPGADLADLARLNPSPAYAHSRVPLAEVISRNQNAGQSHWMAASLPESQYPSLRGTVDVDIAVVGGGTGSIVAAALSAKGYKVALVEASRIAAENTTLSGMAGIGTRYLDEASSVTATELGTDKTKRIMDIAKSGQSWLQGMAKQVGAFKPARSYAVSPDLSDLQNEAQIVTKIDSDAHFLNSDLIKGLIPNAAGAIAIDGEGVIDPVRLAVQSIAREQLRPGSGLKVFEHSPVLSMSVDSRAHLDLPGGRINADRVLVMTGVPAAELTGVNVPLIRKNVYAVTADIGKHPLPPGPVFDDGTFTFYAPVGGNKILFGGAGTKLADTAFLDTALTKVGPLLQDYYPGATIDHAWHRQISAAPDRRGIIDFSPAHGSKVIVASAFGGTGYLFTGASWQLIKSMLAGSAHPFPEAFGLDRPALR